MTVASRLERLEAKLLPAGGVAVVVLQPDGTWELNYGETRTTFTSVENAQRRIPAHTPTIIVDI